MLVLLGETSVAQSNLRERSTAIHSYEVTKNNSNVFVFIVTWIADEEFLNSLCSLRNSSSTMTEWGKAIDQNNA
ncbi:MAG: hypothetical protein LBG48_04395 [Rickettsiales bacterium]|nr:hypothetical protein [Rickettsiales bacterium]